jgi:ribosomal protein S15P/S13E
MNTKRMLLIAVACLLSSLAMGQKDLMERYANIEGVTTVYISKSMLQMMPNLDIHINMNTKDLAGRLSGILILTTERKNLITNLRKDARAFYNNKAFEVLMTVKDEESLVNFYIRRKNDKRIAEMVMVVDEGDEFVLIQMTGDMTMEDIKKMTKGMSNQD